MGHDALAGIEEFCAAQYYAFDAGAWLARFSARTRYLLAQRQNRAGKSETGF